MKTTRIAFRYSRTVNLGNYESVKCELEQELQLDEGDEPAVVRQQLAAEVKAAVKEQLLPLAKLRMDQVREVVEGLPIDLRAAMLASLTKGE